MSETTRTADGVAAIFVTMNRCEIAETCLEKLRAQTVRPGKIIVINNASTDLTLPMLHQASEASDARGARARLAEVNLAASSV